MRPNKIFPMVVFFGMLFGVVYYSFADSKNVLDIDIKPNQVVTQEVKIAPGFAAIIEVPSAIISLAIADQSSFSCNKKEPENNKVLCKPLVTEKFSTNLIITTEHNEFNLILNIDDLGKVNYFKYNFHDGSLPIKSDVAVAEDRPNSNLMDNLLNDFKYSKCNFHIENDYAALKCVEKILVGTETYLKFSISSAYRSPLDIVKCSIAIQTLGGFTGLSLKTETPINTEYAIKTHDLRFGEITYGIVKLPKINVRKDQRMVLSVYTNLGKGSDLTLVDI